MSKAINIFFVIKPAFKIRTALNKKRNYSLDMTELKIIKYIDDNDKNNLIKEHTKKYKIFDNISSIIKNKDNYIELVINIPKTCDILSINKIIAKNCCI